MATEFSVIVERDSEPLDFIGMHRITVE